MVAGVVPVALKYGVILAERGNWQNVIGATLSALSEKEQKKSRKEKPRSKNKKTPLKKLLSVGEFRTTKSRISPIVFLL